MNKLATILCAIFLAACTPKSCDLAVDAVSIRPKDPKVGDQVVVTYRIINNGPDILPAKSYRTIVTVDGRETSLDLGGSHSARKVGEYVEYSKAPGYCDFVPTKSGSYKIRIDVSPKLSVSDPVAGNNTFTRTIAVP